ncbi:MAG: hypothetical protein NTV39_03020 [Candidatus Saccharibacteria bacterium]|nr:hypothetical protein [Candidatus Saccharibacteria bacterium]
MEHPKQAAVESNETQESKLERQKRRRLNRRQNELAQSLYIDPRLLRGLELCKTCRGDGELVGTNLARVAFTSDDFCITDFVPDGDCGDCGGTGFEYGDPSLTAHEWIKISINNKIGVTIEPRLRPEASEQTPDEPIDRVAVEKQIRGIRNGHNQVNKTKQHGRHYKGK